MQRAREPSQFESRRRGARLPRLAAWIGWTVFAGACCLAVVKTSTAQVLEPGPALDAASRRAVFRVLKQAEPAMRARCERNFRGDAWSQDDDFHAGEFQMAQRMARQYGVSLGQVLRAWDDGLREEWEPGAKKTMRVTVPPCRPRPVY